MARTYGRPCSGNSLHNMQRTTCSPNRIWNVLLLTFIIPTDEKMERPLFESFVDKEIELFYDLWDLGTITRTQRRGMMYPPHYMRAFTTWQRSYSFTSHLNMFYHYSYDYTNLMEDFDYVKWLEGKNTEYRLTGNVRVRLTHVGEGINQYEPELIDQSPDPMDPEPNEIIVTPPVVQNPDTRSEVYIQPAIHANVDNLGKSVSSLLGDGFPLPHLPWEFTHIFVVKNMLSKNYTSDDDSADSEEYRVRKKPKNDEIIEILSSDDEATSTIIPTRNSCSSDEDDRKMPAV